MGELKKIAFEEQPEEVKDRVKGYWSKRADSFAKLRKHEMKSNKADRWLTEILTKITDAAMEDADEMAEAEAVADKDISLIKVLDVGCGSGFFEVLLGQQGFEVTGIDLTEEMVAKANGMIAEYGLDAKRVKALTMDAENPDFATESFDVIITRNLTWTLPHPIEAYGTKPSQICIPSFNPKRSASSMLKRTISHHSGVNCCALPMISSGFTTLR